MKKLSVTVKTLFLCLALAGAASCGSKSEETSAPKAAPMDSTALQSVNFRYIDANAVLESYVLAQQLFAEQQKEEARLQQIFQQKQQELQTLGNSIQQKQQNNVYLTQASFDKDVQDFNKKQQDAEKYIAAQQQKLQASMAAAQQRLNDSIANFVEVYNAVKGYDAILMREAGIYFRPDLNITDEIVAGLNARYQGTVPAAAPTK